MINLTPPFGKRIIKIEYILRLGSVYLILLSGVFLSGAALLLPTYVLTRAQYDVARVAEENREIKQDIFDAALDTFGDINAVMVQLSTLSRGEPKSRFIEEVVRNAPAGIVLSSFSFGVSDTGEKTLTLEGRSTTRAALVEFRSAIESSHVFRNVEIPIADLARDVDSPFRMSLIIEVKDE